jgi:hypothetical protein
MSSGLPVGRLTFLSLEITPLLIKEGWIAEAKRMRDGVVRFDSTTPHLPAGRQARPENSGLGAPSILGGELFHYITSTFK